MSQHIGELIKSGQEEVIAGIDFAQIDSLKRLMDISGQYKPHELLSLLIDRKPTAQVNESTVYF